MVLGTAYLLLLLFLLENFIEFHEKVDIHCTASRFFQKIVEIIFPITDMPRGLGLNFFSLVYENTSNYKLTEFPKMSRENN